MAYRIVLSLLLFTYFATVQCYKLVCYFPNWTQWRQKPAKFATAQVDPALCTHVIYAFSKIANGKMVPPEPYETALLTELVALKTKNPSLKILTAIGGWVVGVQPFLQILSTSDGPKKFCASAKAFLQQHRLDGLDWDWEYPAARGGSPADKQNFAKLLRECHKTFNTASPPLLMSAAVAAGGEKLDNGYDVAALSETLDFINIMTYDMRGGWDGKTGHHAPLYEFPTEPMPRRAITVAKYSSQWVAKGAPKKKLIIGLPFYGRSFTLTTSDAGIGAPAGYGKAGRFTPNEKGFRGYHEICQMIKDGATVTRYSKQGDVVVAKLKKQWVGYDDVKTMKTKVEWIKKEGFGGAMVWALDTDDNYDMVCGQGKHPLLRAIARTIGMKAESVEQGKPLNNCPEIDGNSQNIDDCNKKLMEGFGTGKSSNNNNNNDNNNKNKNDNNDNNGTAGNSGDLSEMCKGKPNGAILKHPGQCNMFVQCANGKAWEKNCPNGLKFNAAKKHCDWPQNVTC